MWQYLPAKGNSDTNSRKASPGLAPHLLPHGTLPFIKPDYQVSRERDSILKNFSPYFKLDPEVEKKQITGFDDYLNELLEKYESESGRLDPMGFVSVRRELNSVLSSVYQRGILETDETISLEKLPAEIIVVRGRIAEPKKISSIFVQKSAYQFAEEKKAELVSRHTSLSGKKLSDFVSQVVLYDFIKPNLVYDAATSTTIRDGLIDEVSISRGLVQEGELIISRGEIVDDEKYIFLESLRSEYEKRLGKNDKWLILLGRFILVTSCYLVLYLFMYNFRFDVLSSTHKTFFIILVILLFFIITRLLIYLPGNVVFLIPFAIIPILIRTFYDSRLALFVYLVAIMLAGFIVPNSFEFVFISFIVGVIVIFSLTNVYRRAKLFFAVLMVFLAYSVIYLGIGLMQEGSLSNMNWKNYLWFAGNGVSLLLSYPLIFVFEKTFRFLSDATFLSFQIPTSRFSESWLTRLQDRSSIHCRLPILQRKRQGKLGRTLFLQEQERFIMILEKHIILNILLKIKQRDSVLTIRLDPLKSSEIIIDHVKKGVELARKFNLPSPIIDFIQTHHGTTVAYFFFKKFLDKNPHRTDMEKNFAYPGPKPATKETAIVMMADAVEAASRSLANYSEENIGELVERIIYIQEQDGQFSQTPLTFKDITDIKNVFIKRLSNIYHARIAYPKRETARG